MAPRANWKGYLRLSPYPSDVLSVEIMHFHLLYLLHLSAVGPLYPAPTAASGKLIVIGANHGASLTAAIVLPSSNYECLVLPYFTIDRSVC